MRCCGIERTRRPGARRGSAISINIPKSTVTRFGSLLGGLVFGLLGLYASGLIGSLVVATAGAMMLLYLVRHLR